MFAALLRVSIVFLVIIGTSLTCVTPEGAEEEPQGRIINGKDAKQEDWPFMAAVGVMMNGYFHHFCGGSIWNKDFIITAAHCLEGFGHTEDRTLDQLAVIIGRTDLSTHTRADVFFAQYYNTPIGRTENWNGPVDRIRLEKQDIAIIKLKESIDFVGKNSKAGCVNPPVPIALIDGQNCKIAGWGNTVAKVVPEQLNKFPYKLQEISLPIRSEELCRDEHQKYSPREHYCSLLFKHGDERKGQFKATCDGDSGGPFVCPHIYYPEQFHLMGVSSFKKETFCNGTSFFTQVVPYLAWIQSSDNAGKSCSKIQATSDFSQLFGGVVLLGVIGGAILLISLLSILLCSRNSTTKEKILAQESEKSSKQETPTKKKTAGKTSGGGKE